MAGFRKAPWGAPELNNSIPRRGGSGTSVSGGSLLLGEKGDLGDGHPSPARPPQRWRVSYEPDLPGVEEREEAGSTAGLAEGQAGRGGR